MTELLRRWILLRIKKIEFRVRTWSNALKISRAYSLQKKRAVLNPVLLSLATIPVLGVIFLIIRKIDLRLYVHPEAAIVNIEKNISAYSSQDSGDLKKNIIMNELRRLDTLPQPATVSITDTSNMNNIAKVIAIRAPKVDKSLFVYDSSAVPVTSDDNDFRVIVANKAKHILFLLQKNSKGSWKVVRTYFMAIGSQAGRKATAGDNRTPEGKYLIVERKERYELNSIYGPLAYVLDYPNKNDRDEGRTGQGIWIHGTKEDSIPVETKGCLEINNSDLINLSFLLKSGKGTPVIIIDDSTLENPADIIDTVAINERRKEFYDSLNIMQAEFFRFISDWVLAWESRDIEEYSRFYHHSKFNAQGMEWEDWKEKKKQTFSLYDTIEVTCGKLSLSNYTDSSVVLKFSQSYKTETVRFENNKKLDLERVLDAWKITREAVF